MAGIVFMNTRNLSQIKRFYIDRIGMTVWLDREDCVILRHGNLLLGFHESDKEEIAGLITFFYRERNQVDAMYEKLSDIAVTKPEVDEKRGIYHFFARDPEGRTIEFLSFLHDVEPYLVGDELLVTRRSIRHFRDKDVPDEILWKIFEICRYSPTSKNSQSYYFIVIRDKKKIKYLASLRGISSSPIGRAPLAVAICSDPSKSRRHIQDACIAAYHFILAAWTYGLGTCWIAAMDRDDVKELLGIPKDHYIATITPLGYPEYVPEPPPRRLAREMVRFIP